MKTAKVSELKASLSKYVAHVKSGEEVLVTERGKPVAKPAECVSGSSVAIAAGEHYPFSMGIPLRLPDDAGRRLAETAAWLNVPGSCCLERQGRVGF